MTPHFDAPAGMAFVRPESIFTKAGTYKYSQNLDDNENFLMWDNELNQVVENVSDLQDIKNELI